MFRTFLLVLTTLGVSAAYAQSNPFVGRWGFNLPGPNGNRASWLGVTPKGDGLDIWWQPTGGHVIQVPDYKLTGNHLSLDLVKAKNGHSGVTWDLDASDGKLTGVEKHGDRSVDLNGFPEPALDRKAPKSWTKPEALFDGKDLSGWTPIGDPSHSHWVVKDGILLNEEHGANLKSDRTFTDFKLHFEVNCPDKANAGFYLRGRYELQLEYEAEGSEPAERAMGAIYGRIAPSIQMPRKPSEWEAFDVVLVGRTVTVKRDGKTTIDAKQIDGITGGALDANEGDPGSFYIQGDHTGGLKFRNITVSVPKK